MIYATKYRHKIATLRTDAGPDIILDGEEASPKTLAKALRRQGILEKGERIREYRVCSDGSLVIFPPANSVWHAIRLAPKGDWIPQGDLR